MRGVRLIKAFPSNSCVLPGGSETPREGLAAPGAERGGRRGAAACAPAARVGLPCREPLRLLSPHVAGPRCSVGAGGALGRPGVPFRAWAPGGGRFAGDATGMRAEGWGAPGRPQNSGCPRRSEQASASAPMWGFGWPARSSPGASGLHWRQSIVMYPAPRLKILGERCAKHQEKEWDVSKEGASGARHGLRRVPGRRPEGWLRYLSVCFIKHPASPMGRPASPMGRPASPMGRPRRHAGK